MKKGIIIIICFLGLVLSSCNDLDLAPVDRYTDNNWWKSPDRAESVLYQLYTDMGGAGMVFDNERLTDNVYSKNGNQHTFLTGQAQSSSSLFADEWKSCYEGIGKVHIFLENIDRTPNLNPDVKARWIAEARFIRAFLYFRLTTWYGDVPHFEKLLTIDESRTIDRKPHAEVITWIRNELDGIINTLPSRQQLPKAENGRITKGAVMGLLVRTYLYEGIANNGVSNWTEIAKICRSIMDGQYGNYALFDGTYDQLFHVDNEYNPEVLLCLGYTLDIRTYDNLLDAIPNTGGGRVNSWSPTQELVDSYLTLNGLSVKDDPTYDEENPYVNRDPRLTATVVYHNYEWHNRIGITPATINIIIKPDPSSPIDSQPLTVYNPASQTATHTGYYTRKWFDMKGKPEIGNQASGVNLIIMRYADILLMYAEAMNELNQMSQSVWDETIKPIRERAGFEKNSGAVNYPSLNQSQMRDVIRNERRVELAFEGTRVHDLRRWKTAEIVLNGRPTGAKFENGNTAYITNLPLRVFRAERDYWWAVPQGQLDINPNLGQNPNW